MMNRKLRTAAMLILTLLLLAQARRGDLGSSLLYFARARAAARARFFRVHLHPPALGNRGLRRRRRSVGMVARLLARLDRCGRRDCRSLSRHGPGDAVMGGRHRAAQSLSAPQLA